LKREKIEYHAENYVYYSRPQRPAEAPPGVYIRVCINDMPDEAVKGSMYEVLEYLTCIGFPEDEIVRLGKEFTEAGHTVLETDRIKEADIRHGALEPEEDYRRGAAP
jgi:hypothetical protein